jgi:integrase
MATKHTISQVNVRNELPPRRDPYWSKVQRGCYLGFRKVSKTTDGTWLARFFAEAVDDQPAKQQYKALGDYASLPGKDRHGAALTDARAWFEHLGKGGAAKTLTVRGACENYIAHLENTKGTGSKTAKDVESRFKAYVYTHPKLMRLELPKLSPAHVEAWRKALRTKPTDSGPNRGQQRSDSSLNRDMTCFRAALNLAYKDGHLTSDFAWRGKLLPIEGADKRRTDYLDAKQRKALVKSAAPDLADFLRGLSLLPLRPGALAALKVGDFDKRLKTLRIGKDKSGADRNLSLPLDTARFFESLCKDRIGMLPIFARANGAAWGKDAWKGLVRAAVTAAELPDSVTAYTLRHSVITDLMNGGLDPLTVAALSGTSLAMIQKHYGHLTQKQAVRALAMLRI